MTREEKAQIIDDLKVKLSETNHFYFADASGMTVDQTNEFRSLCHKAGIEYKVVKNTLIKKALEEIEGDYSELYDVLKGFSGIMFSKEIGNLPAKVIKDYRKGKGEKPKLKAASIENAFYIGEDQLEALSKLKSKNELIGEVISLLQSPMANVMSGLQSGKHNIAGIVKTLSEKES
ncbi:MAG: 50S ribosomal protein L10 [Cytophagales bacterium]